MTPAQLLTAAALAFGFGLGLMAQAAAKAERDRLERERLERGVDLLAGDLAAISHDLPAIALTWEQQLENEPTGAPLTASEPVPRPKPHDDPGVAPSSS